MNSASEIVGMNRVGELQALLLGGVMFFWVGGGGIGFIMRHSTLHAFVRLFVSRSEPALRSEGLFSTLGSAAAVRHFLRVWASPLPLSLFPSFFLRRRQLRINVGIAQMSCGARGVNCSVCYYFSAAAVSCRQCRLLIPEEAISAASPPSPLSILPLSPSVVDAARKRTDERAA